MTTSLSSNQQQVIKQVIDNIANTGTSIIEPDDKLLMEFLDIQHQLAGLNAAHAPQLMKQLLNSRVEKRACGSMQQAFSSNAKPVHSIVSLASTDGYNFSSEAVASLPVKATNVTQTLGFFDINGAPIGDVALSQNFVNAANCTIQASGQYADSLNQTSFPVNVIYTFTQTIDDATVYGVQILSSQSYPKEINNIAPTDVNGNNEIKVCLTRDSGDCDYKHPYGGVLTLPIQGSITYFENIDVENGRPINAHNTIYVIREREGGDPVTPSDQFDFFTQQGTTIVGDTLSWDLNWLPFNAPDFNSGEMVYYVFEVTLQIQGRPVVSYITNAPKSLVPDQPVLNTYPIKPMQIVYGCLGEESLILMADGKQVRIDNIHEGDWVCSQDNRKLRVEQVITGTEAKPLELQITIDGNDTPLLVTSPGHPFVTTEGVVTAQELTLDSQLISHAGKVQIIGITEVNQEISVFNLHLSTDDTRELTDDNRTMYANGILVGDSVMQRQYEDAFQLKKENLIEELPEEWHEDLQNYLDLIQ